ncbi:DNA replication complex GINS protein PSF3 [Bulinus truncatus]|nr:DNA replication complex GINS protein PSF3 [Bulinus truncatus]
MALSSVLESNPSNYFSLDDILASQEKIPCTFIAEVSNMGYLDQSTPDTDLVSGTKIELPFWLTKSLDRGSRSIITVDTPKNYKEGYRHIFTADPNVVDLHRLGPYFYLFGGKLLSLNLPDTEDIANVLLKTFQGRFRRIMDCSQNALNVDLTAQMSLLDEQERHLFAAGQQGLHDFQKWESRESEKLSTSIMVANHRKRKRFVLGSKLS